MKVLADARSKLTIPWGNDDCERYANIVLSYDSSRPLEPAVFQQYVQPCKVLWQDDGIRSAFDRKREFQLVGISLKNIHCSHYIFYLGFLVY